MRRGATDQVQYCSDRDAAKLQAGPRPGKRCAAVSVNAGSAACFRQRTLVWCRRCPLQLRPTTQEIFMAPGAMEPARRRRARGDPNASGYNYRLGQPDSDPNVRSQGDSCHTDVDADPRVCAAACAGRRRCRRLRLTTGALEMPLPEPRGSWRPLSLLQWSPVKSVRPHHFKAAQRGQYALLAVPKGKLLSQPAHS